MKTEDGRLVIVSGASRSGKTAWVRQQTKAARRVIVWDIEAQWCELPGFRKVTTQAELFEASGKPGPARLAYVAGGADLRAEFNFWAACVMLWGRYRGGCVAIAEELADVSTPAKAPQEWGMLLRRGLKRGITIYAISQRWAEADKTAIGNASEFVIFRAAGDDVAYISRKARVAVDDVAGLVQLEYIRAQPTGETQRGRLKFRPGT